MIYMEQDLGIGHGQVTSILFTQGLGLGTAFFFCGFLLSKIRPRNMIVLSHLMAGSILLCVSFIEGLQSARLLFGLLGLTSGLYFAAGIATLRSLVRHEDWGKAVGMHELAPNLSFILFPLIAQALLPLGGWKGVLMIWGLLLIVVALVFFFTGKGGTEYATTISPATGLHLFMHPTSLCVMLFLFICISGQFAVYSVLQLYLVTEHALRPDNANFIMSLSRLLNPFMVLLGGWAADAFPPRRVLALFYSTNILGLFLMCIPTFPLAIGGVALQAMSIAIAFPSVFKLIAECFDQRILPVVLSLTMPLAAITGTGLMPWLFGLIGERFGFVAGLIAYALICMPGIALTFFVKPYTPKQLAA